jgi:hypothetical protein
MFTRRPSQSNLPQTFKALRRHNVLMAAKRAQRRDQMGNQDDIPAEEDQVASHLVPTSPPNSPLEPRSPEMPQIPIVAPINEVGPNQDVAPLNPLAPAFVPQQPIEPIVPIVSREEKIALANASRRKQLRQVDLTEALNFLRSLPSNDAIDLDASELKKHNFSDEEFDTLLLQLTANPLPEDTGEQTLRFMEGIETFSERITPADAIRFKSWSDKFKDKKVSLSLCMDDTAKYLIDLEIDRNKERLGLSDESARTWFERWTHNQLAKCVIKLWSGSAKTQNDTIDKHIRN